MSLTSKTVEEEEAEQLKQKVEEIKQVQPEAFDNESDCDRDEVMSTTGSVTSSYQMLGMNKILVISRLVFLITKGKNCRRS